MKYLLAQLKAYKKESILGPLFKLLEAALELMVPLIVAAQVSGLDQMTVSSTAASRQGTRAIFCG